jgi:choline dehydrogenase-like flavoprotein
MHNPWHEVAMVSPSLGAGRFMYSVDEAAQQPCDVLIIGSGPAATAAAEQLIYKSTATIMIVERGDLVTTTHLANVLSFERRRAFVELYGKRPWEGDYIGGRLIYAVGGRGIAAGGLLRRLDLEDLRSASGEWPTDVAAELGIYYELAEQRRRVGIGVYQGPLQVQVLGKLQEYAAYTPPLGFDFTLSKSSYLHDSSAARLWKLNLEDALDAARDKRARRLLIVPNTTATRFVVESGRVDRVECHSRGSKQMVALSASVVLSAASAIESARLALNSGIGGAAAGQYLTDHITCRQQFVATPWSPDAEGEFEVLVPPPGTASDERFQMQVFGGIRSDGKLHFTIVGFGAMDACAGNRVTLSENTDDEGVRRARVTADLTNQDKSRAVRLTGCMADIAAALGAAPVKGELESLGAGYHEAGTLRMGTEPERSVTDSFGKFRDVDNLYATDASVFPSVGVANPMLTVTALAYRQADKVIDNLRLRNIS